MARFFRRNGLQARLRSLRRLVRTLRAHPAALNPLATEDRPSQTFEQIWRSAMKKRVLVIVAVIGVWVVGIQARFVQLQVFQHETYMARARTKQERTLKPMAPRGTITDRHGRMLAYSVRGQGVKADPSLVKDPVKTAAALCDALGDCSPMDRRDLVTKLKGSGGDVQIKHVMIRNARDVSPVQAERVDDLRLPGIVLEADQVRYYPHVELAAHVLGFVGAEGGGAGVELTYDDRIRGRPGLAVAQLNARLQRLETRVDLAPVPGADLELTIDLTLQYIVERELKQGVLENGARGGSAVVMHPMTGEVLAMASYPPFDANIGGRATNERMNRAVEAVYEPGSTFKIVTAAAALESGVVTPTDLIDTNPGYITFPGRRIEEVRGRNYGVISFEDVIVRSSNVGAIKVGLQTGVERLTDYVARFGFGQRSTRELPGGTPGIWSPAGLNNSGLASVSMGYQIGVTPLQMVTAASAVANGGLLMQPRVVRAIERDGRREVSEPRVVRRAITAETAATLTAIMEGVTERGTATAARLDRYQVAGKTGTANKAVDGGYSETDYHASFVGFVPSRRPAFTILVVIDSPRTKGHYGGGVAGPIFKRIAEAGLQHLGVPPTIDPLPPVIVASDRAESAARRRRVPMIIPAAAPLGGPPLMPDVRGLSARDAMRTLGGAGLVVRLSGSGMVVEQMPEPGLPIAPGDWGTIHLARTRPRPPEAGDGR